MGEFVEREFGQAEQKIERGNFKRALAQLADVCWNVNLSDGLEPFERIRKLAERVRESADGRLADKASAVIALTEQRRKALYETPAARSVPRVTSGPTPMGTRTTFAFWAGAVAILFMAIGAFGPWAKVLAISINGLDGSNDGWLVIGAAAIAALMFVVYARFAGFGPLLFAGLAAVGAIAVTIHDRNHIKNVQLVQVGWGLNVALIASILLLLATLGLALFNRQGRQVVELAEAGSGATGASDNTTAEPITESKICPDCAEEVKAAARVCRFCGHRFEEAPVQ